VSSDDQAKEERYSLQQQEEVCLAEIRRRAGDGWIFKETIRDDGYTGSTLDRPGIIRVIALCKAGQIGAVVVYKRDRLFRDAGQAALVQPIFDTSGVCVLSTVEGMADSSPHAVFLRQVLDANSQFERANIRKRQADCLRFAAKRGDWKGGNAPFGYKYVPGSKVLTIDENEAPVVRLIFERAAEGVHPVDIKKELVAKGIYGRPRKHRRTGT
jgi:site-specific DNA recombinase